MPATSSRVVLALCLALGSAGALLADDDPGAKPAPATPAPAKPAPAKKAPPANAIDTASPEALKLADELHVAPNWRPGESTVELVYNFALQKGEILQDWKFSAFELAEFRGPVRKEPNPIVGFDLDVGDGSGTALLDAVETAGDFTFESTFKARYLSASSSDLVVLFGAHGGESLGLRFGQQFVRVRKSGIGALTHNEPSIDFFSQNKSVTLKVQRKGTEVSAWVDGFERGKKTFAAKDLDGKVGFLLSGDLRLRLQTVRLKTVIAAPK